MKSYSFEKVEKNLSEVESIALNNLIEPKDQVIQKAGKGNKVVITDRTKYLEGIKSLLSDNSKFMQLPTDEGKWLNYIINLESKLKDRFKVLKNEEKISKKEIDSICPVGTTPSILYGNPKVHKAVVNNTPKFRPILSGINTPTYLLAKYLNPILSPLTTNEFTVKNSLILLKKLAIMIITLTWLALMLSRYLPTSLWKKLLRTVSTIYSPIIFIVVN